MTSLNIVDLETGRSRPMSDAEAKGIVVQLQETEMTTLDAIAARIGRPINLMKIDIEGAELLALRGASGLLDGAFGPPPVITLEYSNLFPIFGGQRSEIYDQFERRGWTAYRFAKGKNAGGDLVVLASESEAPDHDDLVFVPPGRTLE